MMQLNLTSKDEIDIFEQYFITSPDDVSNAILKAIDEAKNGLFGSPQDIAIVNVKINLLKRFYSMIKDKVLFDFSGTAWGYRIQITCYGIELHMCHYVYIRIENNHITASATDSDFCILKTESKLLTLEEYSEVVSVKAPTLRQWIKRGKLRTAVKLGDEWRVPEYTPVPQYGYRNAVYFIKANATVPFPDTFQYLNEEDFFTVFQDRERNTFCVHTGKGNVTYDISPDEREKLEIFCQLNPDIEYRSPIFESIYLK